MADKPVKSEWRVRECSPEHLEQTLNEQFSEEGWEIIEFVTCFNAYTIYVIARRLIEPG